MKLEEIRDKVSKQSEPMTCEVERGLLRKFLQAIGDPNPLWQDEEYALKTKYNGVIVPPTYLQVLGFEQFNQQTGMLQSVFKGVLNGSAEVECYQPIRPGDKLVLVTKMVDITERQTKMGQSFFLIFETTFNKEGVGLVGTCRSTLIGF